MGMYLKRNIFHVDSRKNGRLTIWRQRKRRRRQRKKKMQEIRNLLVMPVKQKDDFKIRWKISNYE